MTVVQEEIFTADRRHAGLLPGFWLVKYLSEASVAAVALFCGYQDAAAGAEMQRFVARSDAEHQPRSAVEIAKFEAEFGAGECRIDRLVRIEARFALSKFR